LSDSGDNSDDGQAGANVSNDGRGGGGDNEDVALWDKMTTFSVRYHFMPHLVVNHLKTDKCLFLQTFFPAISNAILFEEIAAETDRYVSEKINEAMFFKKYLIWVWWEDITTEELMCFMVSYSIWQDM
jgi:hypothetical protein